MAIPYAIVTVQIASLDGITAPFLAGTNRVYATTLIGSRQLGRTALISAAGNFAINRQLDIPVQAGDSIHLEVDIWDDKEDVAPNRLAHFTMDIVPPWTVQANNFGANPTVKCNVLSTRLVPGGGVSSVAAPRIGGGSAPVLATVAPPNAFCVEIVEILGLYEPGFVPRPPLLQKRANYHDGYTSSDHKGRIYLNRDLIGSWARDTQAIQLTARVTVPSGALPASPKVRWTVTDPDDPFDDAPGVHRQWAAYIDPGDYPGGTPQGAHSNDNEGTPDHNPVWEQVPGFPLAIVSATDASTDLDTATRTSKVKLHCPNVAGDNLIVRAELQPAGAQQVFAAETGIMTMWNRIDVEVIRMTSAFQLPVADVPDCLEPACIQLDFADQQVVANQQFMSANSGGLSTDSGNYVTANFQNNQPGWFCLISAMEPHPLPVVPGGMLFEGDVAIGRGGVGADQAEYVDISGSHSDADYVEFQWAGNSVGFSVSTAQVSGVITRCWLEPHDVQDRFTAGDGSLSHAYATSSFFFPRGKLQGTNWTPGGYGIPSPVHVKVTGAGSFYTSGISPSLKQGGTDYFAGRTLVFTHHGHYRDRATGAPKPNFDSEVVKTVAHEFTHAFGMPHKCGYWDFRTPRATTCFMNYSPNWMLTPGGQLAPGSSKLIGDRHCGRHLKELRRTHIEECRATCERMVGMSAFYCAACWRAGWHGGCVPWRP